MDGPFEKDNFYVDYVTRISPWGRPCLRGRRRRSCSSGCRGCITAPAAPQIRTDPVHIKKKILNRNIRPEFNVLKLWRDVYLLTAITSKSHLKSEQQFETLTWKELFFLVQLQASEDLLHLYYIWWSSLDRSLHWWGLPYGVASFPAIQVISKFLHRKFVQCQLYWTNKNNEKEARNGPLKT